MLEDRADKNFEEKKYSEAQPLYEKLIQKTDDKQKILKAWKRLAEINHYYLKDGDQAYEAYKKVLLYLPPGEDLSNVLKSLADLQLTLMQRPDLAITTLEKLLLLQSKKEEKIKTLMTLAKIYQERRQWVDGKTSMQQVLDLGPSDSERFQIQLMKAYFFNQSKQYDEEVEVYEELLQKSADLSRQNKTAMSLVLSYEQRREWKPAMLALEKWKDLLPEDMVREKQQELKKRISNEPGARGFRK